MGIRRVFAQFLIIAVVSFLGFCVENLWLMMRRGYMDNRNMYLPFLLGYGLAMVAIYLLFGTPQAPRIWLPLENRILRAAMYFVTICLCVMAGEIALGTIVEKLCGIVWWDYSDLPLHITKYTSVPTTIAFGTLITWFMGCFYTPLLDCFLRLEDHTLSRLSCLLMVLIVADFLHSAMGMHKNRKLRKLWQIDLSHTRLHRWWCDHMGNA